MKGHWGYPVLWLFLSACGDSGQLTPKVKLGLSLWCWTWPQQQKSFQLPIVPKAQRPLTQGELRTGRPPTTSMGWLAHFYPNGFLFAYVTAAYHPREFAVSTTVPKA